MSLNIDVTKDALYLEGFKEGERRGLEKARIIIEKEMAKKREEKERPFYIKLLTFLSIEEVAKKFDVSIEYLESLEKEQK